MKYSNYTFFIGNVQPFILSLVILDVIQLQNEQNVIEIMNIEYD